MSPERENPQIEQYRNQAREDFKQAKKLGDTHIFLPEYLAEAKGSKKPDLNDPRWYSLDDPVAFEKYVELLDKKFIPEGKK